MDSLTKIEALPPARRSSMIGQAGVLQDLRTLPRDKAIDWLHKFIHSPISQDWGRLLNALDPDWTVLNEWMQLDKEHALAAADAISARIESSGSVPGTNLSELVAELENLVALHQSPRFKKSLEMLQAVATQAPVPADIARAVQLLFGQNASPPILLARDRSAQWHSVFHQAADKYCVALLDWRASADEQQDAVSALPITSQLDSSVTLAVESVDIGGDEIIIVALPAAQMQELKDIAPANFTFSSTGLRPNNSFKPKPLRGSA